MSGTYSKYSNNYLRMRHKPMRRKIHKRRGMSYWLMSEFSGKTTNFKEQRVVALDTKNDCMIVTDEIHRLYKNIDTDYLRSLYKN